MCIKYHSKYESPSLSERKFLSREGFFFFMQENGLIYESYLFQTKHMATI